MENTAASTHAGPAPDQDDGDVVRVLREDGSLDPSSDPHVSPDLVVALYRAMTRVRALDERLVSLQRQGRIGFHIGSYGEEAAIVGSAAAMRDADWLFPAYREFGAALYRGMALEAYLNHMFGNARDPVKGRQMPDHYSARGARFASVSSPVGTQITHAAGFAWAAKIKREDVVTLVYFGEGATSSGEFHNGINFAGVMKVPLVLFCRNNAWSNASLSGSYSSSGSSASGRAGASSFHGGSSALDDGPGRHESFAEKGLAYGVPFARCDGNDLFAVLKVVGDAVKRAAAGGGPTLIEALTTRLASGAEGAGGTGRGGAGTLSFASASTSRGGGSGATLSSATTISRWTPSSTRPSTKPRKWRRRPSRRSSTTSTPSGRVTSKSSAKSSSPRLALRRGSPDRRV